MSKKGNNPSKPKSKATAYTPPKPKRKVEPLPNLPQHNHPQPYSRLMLMGDSDEEADYIAIADELERGDASAAVAKLLEMVLDQTYYEYARALPAAASLAEPRQWTRTHAIRVLAHMGDAARSAIDPLLPLFDDDDEWVAEELPFFYAAMGEAAIEPLSRILNDHTLDEMLRSGAGDSLAELGETHPELRDRVVTLLEQALIAETEDVTATAFFIINLMDLGAKESFPLIEQAYREDRVDDSIVQLCDVEEHFGLPITKPRTTWTDDLEAYEEEDVEDDEAEESVVPGSDLRVSAGPWSPTGDPVEPSVPYVAAAKVGRNEPCPCGSGKKYKKCCGA